MCYFSQQLPTDFWHCFLSQGIIKSCLIERTCTVTSLCTFTLFGTLFHYMPHTIFHINMGQKMCFWDLRKCPPSWSFHSMREPFCLTKPFGTVAHKELLWAALALITWLSGPQDIDPEPFFLVTPKVLQFLCEMEWYLKGTQAHWTCPKWW